MGEKRQKDGDQERAGYTRVNGLAIAALIARAMPPAQRQAIMERISSRSPVTGAALEASMEKIEVQIQNRSTMVARQISAQLSLPETKQAPAAQPATPPPPAGPRMTKFVEASPEEELSPAEQLLQSREGSHEELERELERQRPTPGRRRIISA